MELLAGVLLIDYADISVIASVHWTNDQGPSLGYAATATDHIDIQITY